MAMDIDKWIELFPGVRPKAATLTFNFKTPIWRDFAKYWGYIPVSKESLKHFLSKSNAPQHPDNKDGFTSNAVAIVVGGAHEALDSKPGQYIITLKNRKGFVKMAIQTGSALVPSISFGEVDLYEQIDNPPGSLLRAVQVFIKKHTSISPVILKGRGSIPGFSILPFKRSVTQVLGAPILVEKRDNPTDAYINEVHEKFIDALQRLFENHKHKYIANAEKTKLIIT